MRHPGRGGEIRTPDPLLPKQMRYQTALHPEERAIISAGKGSAKTTGDVVLSLLFFRLDEDLVCLAELDHLAKIHVGGEV